MSFKPRYHAKSWFVYSLPDMVPSGCANVRAYGMTDVVYRSLQEIASGATFDVDCSVCFALLGKELCLWPWREANPAKLSMLLRSMV
jgi:hypothetical protein